MRIRTIKAFCRRSALAELRQVRAKLAAALLRGALAGTNALEGLKEVDRAIARRELEGLFKT